MKTCNRLYILTDNSLTSVYSCVQGGHAVAQWLLDHPNQQWNNSYLIYLHCDIEFWKKKLSKLNIDYSYFNEPDLDNKTTAIAVLSDGKIFKKLKLVS